MNMKTYLFLLILISFNVSYANKHSQTIYQYANQSNITEFSDMMSVQQTTVRQIEIPKTTLEQQQSINEKIIKYQKFNKEFNKRYYDEKKKQYEAARNRAEQKKLEKQRAQAEHDEAVSKLSRHKRHKHLRRDRIRKEQGKKDHSF